VVRITASYSFAKSTSHGRLQRCDRQGIAALAGKLRGIGRPRPHRVNGRTSRGETHMAVADER